MNIRLCPHPVAPPVKIMPRPFFHERGIACGTTCSKVPMAKMITVKDLIIISHSYCFFYEKWNASHVFFLFPLVVFYIFTEILTPFALVLEKYTTLRGLYTCVTNLALPNGGFPC